jgi:hypothetical protein
MPMRNLAFMLVLAAVLCLGCKDARRGQSIANEAPVPDGNIVLLKRNKETAAFILTNQRMSPEQTDFYWYYRSDGGGTFPSGEPAVASGFVSNTSHASQVTFSTFHVDWSIYSNGMGWVYFSKGPTDFAKAADYFMCVTTETNLAKIDANSDRWKYRAHAPVNVKALIESQIKQ